MAAILSLNNVEVIYDKIFLAVKGVSLEVSDGKIAALLGANGAGKSTTLKTVSGLLKPERGEVTRGEAVFMGHDLGTLLPPVRVQMGIAQVLEGRRVFEHLNPDENLLAASSFKNSRKKTAGLIDRVYNYYPQLRERRRTKAGYLSGGEQQMLAIGRALMTEPRLLMLDEPGLGLAPMLVAEIFQIIRRINREDNVSMLLVEQNAVVALEIVSYAYLMENGRIVMDGLPEVLKENPDIKEFYLGGKSKLDFHQVKHYRRRKRWLA